MGAAPSNSRWPREVAARQICAVSHCVTFHYAVFELLVLLLESND
jgi:hypothetical protein